MAEPDDPENLEDDGLLHANGIDALTGKPIEPIEPGEILSRDPSTPRDPSVLGRLSQYWNAFTKRLKTGSGLPEDLVSKANDPAAVGWAVVFSSDTPAEIRDAVEPLIAHRRDHTRVEPDQLKVLEIAPGTSLDDWLKKIGAHRSDVEPTRLPYYVMFVGGPASIPFEHQSELGIGYAVGRLSFDHPDDYRRYVESVIRYETAGTPVHGREIVYWGTRNRADRATQLSADCLVKPLIEGDPTAVRPVDKQPISEVRGFRSRFHLGASATRANLLECLHGGDPSARPAFLFTASHGLGFPKGHEHQTAQQGALLCQDWPGVGTRPDPSHCLTAADLDDDARVHGLIAFLFACYGAGTPASDHFLADRSKAAVPIADSPFVAALPKRLLAHPGGGALAVIGHVERAWGYSIRPAGLGSRLLPFRNLIGKVLGGNPVGFATKDFGDRYANASTRLLNLISGTNPAAKPRDSEMAALWVERNDAQNYILLGDPAVRLRVEAMS
ncbi:MAG: hypothetical protein ACLQGP_24400 [Isosphaeraceae bacterium]